MSRLFITFILALFLVTSVIAAPVPDGSFDIDNYNSRSTENLEVRDPRIHIHFPKIHFPKIHIAKIHIDGKKILNGLRKWAPKVGKIAFKVAKMLLRREGADLGTREVEENYIRQELGDIDAIDARSPELELRVLLRALGELEIEERDIDWALENLD